MEFKLKLHNRNTSESELLKDLIRVKEGLNKQSISRNDYTEHEKYSSSTIQRRFGSWNNALIKSGIKIKQYRDISEDELFQNLQKVWTTLGRQPKYQEFRQPLSKFSVTPYENRFGSWNNALVSFIEFIESKSNLDQEKLDNIEQSVSPNNVKHKTKKNISERLRFRILLRDGFTCRKCGRSPLKDRNVELHVDHLIPWSKGGETVIENLETKCDKCNLGKGNAFSGV